MTFLAWAGAYLLAGGLTSLFVAYDPYAKRMDWDLGGWHPMLASLIITWAIVILGFPIVFPRTIVERIKERKYVKQWRKTGRVVKPLR